MSSKRAKPRAAAIKTSVVTITPKMAFEFLEKNVRNRPICQHHVEHLANEMKVGRWEVTGEPITFSSAGTLINGQHRLTACVLSGIPFKSLVVQGVEPQAFNKLDQGRRRSLGDAFARDSKRNATLLASACYVLFLLEKKGTSVRCLPIDEGFAVLRRHPLVEKYVALVRTFPRPMLPLPASYAVGYLTWTAESWGEPAVKFWTRVCTGEDVAKGSPESLLIRALRSEANQLITKQARQAYCAKAFNAAITDFKLSRLNYDPNKEAMPEFLR